jgi:N,N-dimethylformamidase
MPKITAYADRISACPGEAVNFMVNCESAKSYQADLVRLRCGDENPAGPGFQETVIKTPASRRYKGRKQTIHAGSFARVAPSPALAKLSSFTFQAFIWPTTPAKGTQGIVSYWRERDKAGAALIITKKNGALALCLGDGSGKIEVINSGRPLLAREWYFVAASYDAERREVRLYQEPLTQHGKTRDRAEIRRKSGLRKWGQHDAPLIFGAYYDRSDKGRTVCKGHFNGKIDSPRIANRALSLAEMGVLAGGAIAPELRRDVVGAWDFSLGITTTEIFDRSDYRLNGEIVQMPARAMTGHNWNGTEMNWRNAPEQYGAIHFHDDDLIDAGWETDFSLTIPKGLRSGLYAMRLRCTGSEDYVPFAVRPPRGKATAKVVYLLPSASYLAYANERMATDAPLAQLLTGKLSTLSQQNVYLDRHREYGASCYDSHSDGSGVCYSSRLRPILNMRPKYSCWLGGKGSGLWQFNADTHINDWLDHERIAYDVVTDEDLHYEGLSVIENHNVLVTATHPEYWSKEMWDALEGFKNKGGRLMYLGANGWYWRVAYHRSIPGVMEVRRNEGGIRAWEARTGEYYHSFTGEYGGLWRRNGRPPQVMAGTGFSAQGFDLSSYYRQQPDALNPRAAFIMKGIKPDELIGNFGLIGGGAAGLELDRADRMLGTPPNALVLASSENHTDIYLVVCEEILINYPGLGGQEHDFVRADIVFYELASGGAVFSSSSIAWAGSLAHNDYQNNVARMTKNVLKRFIDLTPFS